MDEKQRIDTNTNGHIESDFAKTLQTGISQLELVDANLGDITTLTSEQIDREKKAITRNIVLVGFAFFLNFTAYLGLARLQSSLHEDAGLGTIAQSVLYSSLVVSSLFLPNVMINQLGHKWTIPISIIGYIVWLLSNGYYIYL